MIEIELNIVRDGEDLTVLVNPDNCEIGWTIPDNRPLALTRAEIAQARAKLEQEAEAYLVA